MTVQYEELGKKLKVLSDPKRLEIVDMLSQGELCACMILESFQITQPTLSHDMKLLVDSGIVVDRREGKNTYYALHPQRMNRILEDLGEIFTVSSGASAYSGSEFSKGEKRTR